MTKLLTAAIVSIAAASLSGTPGPADPPLPVARSEVASQRRSTGDHLCDRRIRQRQRRSERWFKFFARSKQNGQVDGEWHDVAPLPRGLNHVGAVGYRGKIYTFGGFAAQNDAAVADANVYDPATNRWTPIASLPRALGSISVAVLGNEIHLVGGRDVHSVADASGLRSGDEPLFGTCSVAGRTRPYGPRRLRWAPLCDRRSHRHARAHNTAYVDIYDPRHERVDVGRSDAEHPQRNGRVSITWARSSR